jgi:hypothetical protein
MNHLYPDYTAATVHIWGTKTPRLIKWPWLDWWRVVTVKTAHKTTLISHILFLKLLHTYTYWRLLNNRALTYTYSHIALLALKKLCHKRWEINNHHCLHIPRFTSATPSSRVRMCSYLEPNFRRNRDGVEKHYWPAWQRRPFYPRLLGTACLPIVRRYITGDKRKRQCCTNPKLYYQC